MSKIKMTCITCPIGCQLEVAVDLDKESGYIITGNECKRGIDYAINEITNPTRVLTSTVKIKNALLNRLPVRTDGSIPKSKIIECMEIINSIDIQSPVKVGEVLVKNILDTGVNLIASRSM